MKATCTILTVQKSEDYTTQGEGLDKFTEEQYHRHVSNKPSALSTQAGRRQTSKATLGFQNFK